MRVQLLVSTMNQKNYDLLNKINLQTDAVIINQTNVESQEEFFYKEHKIIWINTLERGLSKSRNMAIKNSSCDLGLLVDDDEILVDGYEQIIIEAFEKYDATVIGFQAQGIETLFKNYSPVERKINYLNSMKMSSVELVLNIKKVRDYNLSFNELIGAGTEFLMGEESAFLFEVLSKKGKIFYVPKTITTLHIGDSTWFEGYNKKYFIARGAAFTAMSKKLSVVLIFQFAIRKIGLYKGTLSFFNAINCMMTGRKKYIKTYKNMREKQL